jgi:branched-chain amino acid transport system permease protein
MIAKSNEDVMVPVRIGLLGGLIAVLIALQGMIQTFSARDIVGGVISMSQTLLLMTLFVTGYLAVSRSGHVRPVFALFAGALSGFLASLLVVALIFFGKAINLGAMMVNATSELYDLLTFKQGLMMGSLFLLIAGVVLGALSALTFLLPSKTRRPIVVALVCVIVLGVLQDLLTITLSNLPALTPVVKFFYVANGLSIAGAVTLFVLVAAISYFWSTRGTQIQNRINGLPPASRRGLRWSAIGIVVVILLLLPSIVGLYISEVLDLVGMFLLMGLGLNIVVGFAGLLDLGYVAFFAIGAYTVGVLTSPELGRAVIMGSWWAALPFGIAVAMFAGVILGVPVLKMRGDYLAIVTLGFGEIIRILALSDLLKPFLGGAQGTRGIAKPDIGLIQINWGPQAFYYFFLVGALLVIFIATRVKSSRLGRAWMAVREDEDVAQAMGINLVATKLLAFAMGASFGGLSGAIFASKLGSIFPSSFNFLISINVLSLIIIGGMGSIPGVVVGALALVGLPELMREFAEFRYLFYGIGLVVMMLTRPEGLWPEAARSRELHEAEAEAEVEPATAGAVAGK